MAAIGCIIERRAHKNHIRKNKLMNRKIIYLTLAGIVLGAVAGYSYYYFVGCASGTCAITSKPINSSLYGALMGGLLFNLFATKK